MLDESDLYKYPDDWCFDAVDTLMFQGTDYEFSLLLCQVIVGMIQDNKELDAEKKLYRAIHCGLIAENRRAVDKFDRLMHVLHLAPSNPFFKETSNKLVRIPKNGKLFT